MSLKMFHNPKCSKSRRTLQYLEDANVDFDVVEYLKDVPDQKTLAEIHRKLGLPVMEMIREREHKELGLPETNDVDELLTRITQYPAILQRPIVVSNEAAQICRPPENVLELLT